MEMIKYSEGDTEILLPWSTKAGQKPLDRKPGGTGCCEPARCSLCDGRDQVPVLQGLRDGCMASRELGPPEKPEGMERGWKEDGKALLEEGYQHNLPPLLPRIPDTVLFLTSLQQEEFLLSMSSLILSPVAHKIINTSPKLDEPLPPLLPIVQINDSTLHH